MPSPTITQFNEPETLWSRLQCFLGSHGAMLGSSIEILGNNVAYKCVLCNRVTKAHISDYSQDTQKALKLIADLNLHLKG